MRVTRESTHPCNSFITKKLTSFDFLSSVLIKKKWWSQNSPKKLRLNPRSCVDTSRKDSARAEKGVDIHTKWNTLTSFTAPENGVFCFVYEINSRVNLIYSPFSKERKKKTFCFSVGLCTWFKNFLILKWFKAVIFYEINKR